ncbi:mechanosensitive ion channel family protein [Sphingomicrobium astaxanthinifaciens]|uniref:mechanosensitive ion channel family protein n=1 Tax=Sphingomicrobium astaxanthinifaciens TaxID=1227949 RepID=UPI001FCAD10C|nr:mechanosensitive ion channel family protein [Sphingomicrobium astaxanthinifaciens]MCJ7420308.1 mechanosensitive ion channel family protein [Sphingomicrobium astaxanthinifaciens]
MNLLASATIEQVDADFNESMETINGLVDGFFAALPKMAIALVVFLIFWVIAGIVRKVIRRASFGDGGSALSTVFSRIAYWVLLIVGLFVALTIVLPSLTPGQLIGGLGIGGLAIGFAFQDIFQNLLAGILILIRQPFRVGDEIESGDFTGRVEAIETRATFIRTFDGRRVIIPNKQIYSDPLKVVSAFDHRRSQYDIGIGYGDDIRQAKAIILETLENTEGVLGEPAPDVLVEDLAASWITLRARWWHDSVRSDEVRTRSRVIENVAYALTEAGIDLPFETNVLLFHDQTEETDGDRSAQREGWPSQDDNPRPRYRLDRPGDGDANRGRAGTIEEI